MTDRPKRPPEIPTTAQVRGCYVLLNEQSGRRRGAAGAEFDAWLRRIIRAATANIKEEEDR